MAKYRKKPVVVEAIQLSVDNVLEVERFIEQKEIRLDTGAAQDKFEDYKDIVRRNGRKINTLEGAMTAKIGDYIIKGVSGEFYPCKPDIFEKTYEKVDKAGSA